MAIDLTGSYQSDFARVWSREGLDYTEGSISQQRAGAVESSPALIKSRLPVVGGDGPL